MSVSCVGAFLDRTTRRTDMHHLLKSTLKGMTPPMLLQLLRPNRTPSDAWGTVRYGLHGLRLPGGRRFIYRPSLVDRTVCAQIFFRRDYATEHLSRSQEIID